MTVKLSDLSKKTGLSAAELKEKLRSLGMPLKPLARSVDDAAAETLENALKIPDERVLDLEAGANHDTAHIYDYAMEKELDKEIIKSQRKMTAGKDTGKTKKPAGKPVVTPPPLPPAPRQPGSDVEIPDVITVKEFSEKTGLSPIKVIGELMKNGITANINQSLDFETATIIADDFGIKLKRKRAGATAEDISMGNLEMLLKEDDERDLSIRAPIVTIMGHVDHGKTSLLDAIRETDVAKTEAGGITQHIGAYQVEKNGRKITFIDTPGHEAFTAMRARGAKITDIVILVVAADEGVKPQTIEALNHAKEAEVPIMVAMNKIDKEGANVDRVKAQLAELGLQPDDWGGKTIMAPVSAATGEGIPTLLEMILLTADSEKLRANPNRPAVATVIEAHLDKNLGPVSTIIVNTGTLHIHDAVVCGKIFGRVKSMKNHLGVSLKEAPPSTPVQISGLESTPSAGDVIQVVGSLEEARRKSSQIGLLRHDQLGTAKASSLENIMANLQAGKLKTLKVVVKADTVGSLDAMKLALSGLKTNEVSLKVIHGGVGGITESDVMMSGASQGVIIGFNTLANPHVADVAARAGVQIFTYQIIYRAVEDMKKILTGLLEPQVQEVIMGRAEVRKIFMTERKTMIVGCRVVSGFIENKSRLRVFRKEEKIGEGILDSLKKINDVVPKVTEGTECGVRFVGDVKLEEGDVLESWKEERKTRLAA